MELNDKINKRINDYMEETVLPDLHVELQDWIEQSDSELNDSQTYLREMSDSLIIYMMKKRYLSSVTVKY